MGCRRASHRLGIAAGRGSHAHWQEVEGKLERFYTADLEKDKERLRMLGFEHPLTALYITRKELSEEYMEQLNRESLRGLSQPEKWVRTLRASV